MTLADAQQQRLLERLRQAGDQPVAFDELHAGGIDFPAAVVFELELNGYASSASMTTGGLSACACSIQNPGTHPTHPLHTGGADRTDSQLQSTWRSSCTANARELWCGQSRTRPSSGRITGRQDKTVGRRSWPYCPGLTALRRSESEAACPQALGRTTIGRLPAPGLRQTLSRRHAPVYIAPTNTRRALSPVGSDSGGGLPLRRRHLALPADLGRAGPNWSCSRSTLWLA